MAKKYTIHPIPLMTLFDFLKLRLVYPVYAGLRFDYTEKVSLVNYIWYLKGGDLNVIVDAGMTAERFAARGRRAENIQTLDEGLGKLGLKPDDIDVVILTHLDHDHIALTHRFTKAKVVVQRAELEFARNPHPFYRDRAVDPPDYAELISGLDYQVVSGDAKIEDGIEVLFTPGHSAGGQSVAVNTARGIAVIVGLCCIGENFNPPPELQKRGVSFMIPGVYLNAFDAYESMARIKKRADIIVPLHEPDFRNKATIP
jgi:N-acyl homoserine lactone hydrolase